MKRSSRDTDRLFVGRAPDVLTAGGRSALIEKLLEEGDSSDLRYLASTVGEEELAGWFESQGGRRLSFRSRVFWSWVLDRPIPEPHPLTEQIWPL